MNTQEEHHVKMNYLSNRQYLDLIHTIQCEEEDLVVETVVAA